MQIRLIVCGIFLIMAFNADADCLDCHASAADSIATLPHKALVNHSDPSSACTSCHGDGAGHPSAPGSVLTFAGETLLRQNAACSGCHTGQHSAGSAHSSAGVACVDCHVVHGNAEAVVLPAGFERIDKGSATCARCHDDVLAQFAFNKRHRLQENSVSCTSCHDPHDRAKGPRLASATESVCTGCHADKDGPFLFEHDASRVDGCLACHTPHGSSNRHLLTHQQTGELCYSCHADVPQFHLGFAPVGDPRFGTGAVCTNCHVTIHGSNIDPGFLK
ncbi:MAG: cytochrome c3 family protein [Halioglobus sp.]|nr:cytochrome c3 family protein [Halioglobus sp.]